MISIEKEQHQQHGGFYIFDEYSLDTVGIHTLEDVEILLKACKEFLDERYSKE